MAFRPLLLEDGVTPLLLEDGVTALLLEDSDAEEEVTADAGGVYAAPAPPPPGRYPILGQRDDQDLLELLPIVIGVMNQA